MPTGLSPSEIKRYALVGAQARLEELRREQTELLRAFPDLASGRAVTSNVTRSTLAPPNGKRARRQVYNMSAAARKEVSVRMKRYWAQRRKEKEAAGK